MAKLYFRYGAMGSSKTANAIMVQYNYQERGQNALMLKPLLDNRDGARVVASRSGLSAPCRFVEDLPSIDVTAYDCVIVDEAQFLRKEQVEELVGIVDDLGIPVICYGLRADFQGNLFEGSHWLMAWADTIEEIKTVCWCGRKATCNARVQDGRVVKAGEQIMLGGNESYVALCRKHWARGELAPLEIRRLDAGQEAYRDLLLLADPDWDMVLKYLPEGEMYVLRSNGKGVCEAVVNRRPDGACELKNLATAEEEQGKGHAGRMLRYLFKVYAPLYREMYVGTADPQVGFYERFGFERAYVEKDFFVKNYPEPIVDKGFLCVDMIYLKRDLRRD